MTRLAAAKDDPRQRTSPSPAPAPQPARPDPSWVWVNLVAMVGALVLATAALVDGVQSESLHTRLCAFSTAVIAYAGYVWLCCLLARARGYHPAWGLIGVTVLGGFVLPFLPADPDDDGPLVRRGPRAAYWAGLRHVASLVIIWAFIVAAFWNSFQSQWVLDNLYIIKLDPRTRADSWKSAPNNLIDPGAVEYFQQDYWWPKGISGLYRPLTSITYWANYRLADQSEQFRKDNPGKPVPPEVAESGFNVNGYHVVNMVLHALNAMLVYALAWVLSRRWPVALIAGLIFAVHPITTESVTNIIGRADQFAALAVLAGALVWRWAAGLPRWWTVAGFAAVMLITALGVFAKESAAALGLVILIYDVIYRWRPEVARLFGWVVLLALVPLIGAGSFAAQHPWWERMGETVRVIVAAVVVIAGVGTHVLLTRATPQKRLGAILLSLGFAVLASAFVPAAGLALFVLVVLYECMTGPWWRDRLPEFDRIKWPAALYTAGFCAFVFVPLAFGALVWHEAGADAKHSSPDHALIGALNVLGGSCPPELRVWRELGFGERLLRAGMLVGAGVLAWLFFATSRPRLRVALLLLVGALPLLALIPLARPHTFELDAGALVSQNARPRTVHVTGSFDQWSLRATPMTDPDGDGVYEADVYLPPGVHHYKFLINGTQRSNDPSATATWRPPTGRAA